MAIMDKGYYDYDYQEVKPQQEMKTIEETAKSNEEVKSALARFGWGRARSAEALQEAVIKDIKERSGQPTK